LKWLLRPSLVLGPLPFQLARATAMGTPLNSTETTPPDLRNIGTALHFRESNDREWADKLVVKSGILRCGRLQRRLPARLPPASKRRTDKESRIFLSVGNWIDLANFLLVSKWMEKPSSNSTTPVIADASAELRSAAASATSSGATNRQAELPCRWHLHLLDADATQPRCPSLGSP
jgi:hypothetical protein